ncbi:forkhead box protein G1-like [Ptychodera flava]|uniref:forkhead box protein G1-like n=1 Tax=Ptychodera flava TaxID=63121 RepID=UPI00396A5569
MVDGTCWVDSILDKLDNYSTHIHKEARPPYSYVVLTIMAIRSKPDKMISLQGIYEFVETNFPYYRNNKHHWRNSVRQNLSLNEHFVRVEYNGDGCMGGGNLWALKEGWEVMFDEGSGGFRKRRRRRNVRHFGKALCRRPETIIAWRSPLCDEHRGFSNQSRSCEETFSCYNGQFHDNTPSYELEKRDCNFIVRTNHQGFLAGRNNQSFPSLDQTLSPNTTLNDPTIDASSAMIHCRQCRSPSCLCTVHSEHLRDMTAWSAHQQYLLESPGQQTPIGNYGNDCQDLQSSADLHW